jgi:hypothetical protein
MQSNNEKERIIEAYGLMIRKLKYRAVAPCDELGLRWLTEERLAEEAKEYANRFSEAEEPGCFSIGVSTWSSLSPIMVYVIEAARSLCGDDNNLRFAIKLLALAQEEAQRLVQDVELEEGRGIEWKKEG